MAENAIASVILVPGGGCEADRYDWLSVLVDKRINLFIAGGAITSVESTIFDRLNALSSALEGVAELGLPITIVGHSAGAALVLDALDPTSNKLLNELADFKLPVLPNAVVILGCTLQSKVMNMNLRHRYERRELSRPDDVDMLFIAGQMDALATPNLVGKTCERFRNPPDMIVMAAATHYGWAGGPTPSDNPQFDLAGPADVIGQCERTVIYLGAMAVGKPIQPIQDDQLVCFEQTNNEGELVQT